jgi:DNA-binding response OmpR family regulator
MRGILLIDDAEKGERAHGSAGPVACTLVAEGHVVTRTAGSAAARDPWADTDLDLVLVDLTHPRPGGTRWCRRIREHTEVPLIVRAAWDEEDDRVGTLAGGTQY